MRKTKLKLKKKVNNTLTEINNNNLPVLNGNNYNHTSLLINGLPNNPAGLSENSVWRDENGILRIV